MENRHQRSQLEDARRALMLCSGPVREQNFFIKAAETDSWLLWSTMETPSTAGGVGPFHEFVHSERLQTLTSQKLINAFACAPNLYKSTQEIKGTVGEQGNVSTHPGKLLPEPDVPETAEPIVHVTMVLSDPTAPSLREETTR